MELPFTKMTGAGNDFVVIDNREGIVQDGPGLARIVCERHFGIGADGLLLLEKSKRADFRMMYYNADGSYGGMCGNGGRCISRFALENRIAGPQHSFEALEYVYKAAVSGENVELAMKDASDIRTAIMLPTSSGMIECGFVDTGSPHVVIVLKEDAPGHPGIASIDVEKVGREIRHHKEFAPLGTNVNFIKVDGGNRLRIRTYERGVEAETLACGTGSIAAAIMGMELHLTNSPVEVRVKSGSTLAVQAVRNQDGSYGGVKLKGPALGVFSGIFRAP